MLILENDFIRAEIKNAGAELVSLYGKQTGIEYLWNGDAKFWGRYSPVLFPIVGALKTGSFTYQSKTYRLEKHGFARDSEFKVESAGNLSATFSLSDNPSTENKYPFKFIFKITYSLKGNSIKVKYEVINPSNDELLFSVGAHPAFAVPNTVYEDYFLEFEQEETAGIWPIENDLIGSAATPFLTGSKTIPLKHDLFYNDALVFKNLSSKSISLLNSKNSHGITLRFPGFPYLGIWSAKDAPFVCIEPWCGIADSVNHTGELTEKEGIIKAAGNSTWQNEWQVECF